MLCFCGEYEGNFELSLALSHILQISPIWWNARICIKTLVANAEVKQKKELQFERYHKRLRIKNLIFNSIIDTELDFNSVLLKNSSDANMTFVGLRCLKENETLDEYKEYYSRLINHVDNLENVIFVLAGENLSFEKIFFD